MKQIIVDDFDKFLFEQDPNTSHQKLSGAHTKRFAPEPCPSRKPTNCIRVLLNFRVDAHDLELQRAQAQLQLMINSGEILIDHGVIRLNQQANRQP